MAPRTSARPSIHHASASGRPNSDPGRRRDERERRPTVARPRRRDQPQKRRRERGATRPCDSIIRVMLTLPIRDVRSRDAARAHRPARSRRPRVRLPPGQAVLDRRRTAHATRRPYSIAAAPEDAARDGCLELLVGVDADGSAGTASDARAGRARRRRRPARIVHLSRRSRPSSGSCSSPAAPASRRCARCCTTRSRIPHREHRPVLQRADARTNSRTTTSCARWRASGRIELRQTVTRDRRRRTGPAARGRIGRAALRAARPRSGDAVFRLRAAGARRRRCRSCSTSSGSRRARIRIEEW